MNFSRLSMVLLFLASNAQAAPLNDALQFFDEQQAMVISASKHLQKTLDAPANVYIIGKDDIERYGYRTLGEALQNGAGFYVNDNRTQFGAGVRGFARVSDFNYRILVLINGHRTNNNLYGAANYDYIFNVDMRSVERIEVVKGPGSALYGDNAFLAVVNVVTKTAKTAPTAQVNAETGSYGMNKEFLGLSHSFKNGLSFYTSGSYRYMKGQDLFYPDYQAINNGIAAKGDREEGYNLFATLSGSDWQLTGNVVKDNRRNATGISGAVFNEDGTYANHSTSFVEFKKDMELSDNVKLTARAYWDWYYSQANFVFQNFLSAPPPDNIILKSYGRADWYGEEVSIRATPFGEDNAFLFGQDFEKTDDAYQSTYVEDPAFPLTNDRRNFNRWSLFAQQELKPFDKLELNLGARFDRYQTFGNTVNPRIAIVYHPWADGSFKLLYGSAFRAPTPAEQVFDSFGGLTELPKLGPERITTYEADYEHDFARQGMVSVGFFQSRARDIVDLVPANAPALGGQVLAYGNQDKVRTDGAEVNGKMDFRWNISGHVNFTIQSTHLVGGDRLDNSPTELGTIGLSKRLPWLNDSTFAGEVFFISSNKTTQGTTDPATALLSLHARIRPWGQGPLVYANVYNVLNTSYLLSSSPGELQAANPQDGRNFTVGLEYRFGNKR